MAAAPPLFDADNHYYEPPDCFTRFIEPRFRDLAIRTVVEDGRESIRIGDRPFTFLENVPYRVVSRPGSLREMLRNLTNDDYNASDFREPVSPEFLERDARLQRMDEQGLTAALLFPTLAVCVEHFLKDDVDQCYANLHAFNRWLHEDWGFDHLGRIYGVPLLSLLDVDRAVQELDWVMERGARVISLRPGPAFGRSPADPHFDPFWARIDEAQIAVAFHIGESGYNEMMSVHFGEQANPPSHRQSAMQWASFYGDRPIMDTISSMIFYNLFGRFPRLRVLSVENGSLWVPYLMKVMDKMKGMGRNGPWPGGYVRGRPSEVLKRHVFVSPYHEEDLIALTDAIGASQVLFGSDYPHPEGLAEPHTFEEGLSGLPPEQVRQIMHDNTYRLATGLD